jgi:hypothetical protein
MRLVLARKEASLNPSVNSYAMTASDPDNLASVEHLIKRVSVPEIERDLRGLDSAGKSAAMGLCVHGSDYIGLAVPGWKATCIVMLAQSTEKKHLHVSAVCPNTSRAVTSESPFR